MPNDPAANATVVPLSVVRFDTDFFAMDTNQITKGLEGLYQKQPLFADQFFKLILMTNPLKDTLSVKAFYRAYLPIYKHAAQLNAPEKVKQDLTVGLSRFHFYFPTYTMPSKIIYFIGPLEGYGNVVTMEGIAIGLQMYLGAKAPWYFSQQIQSIYPTYISRKFEPAYIPVIAMQNMVDDLSPLKTAGKNGLINMVEAGKRQFVIKNCLPNTADTLIWGYTQKQLSALISNENQIWTFIVHQKLLYSVAQIDIQNLMHDAAHNDNFGEDIPGSVGKYIGYQIVKDWIAKQSQKTSFNLAILLSTPAQEIFDGSGYNP